MRAGGVDKLHHAAGSVKMSTQIRAKRSRYTRAAARRQDSTHLLLQEVRQGLRRKRGVRERVQRWETRIRDLFDRGLLVGGLVGADSSAKGENGKKKLRHGV